ncbi:MAG: class I tRNA ligase family protein, partial [bacterium]|nr:class I tRNA ligase family protein [bacterium]
ITNYEEVDIYIEKAKKKSELERLHLEKEKTGVQLKGIVAINPANGSEIPVWIADYVLASYGTGAIMAVPAHDERDFAFAKKYELPSIMVVCPHYPAPTCPILNEAYTGSGHLVESGKFTGLPSEDAKGAITEFVGGIITTQYKLRDWLISRQRYWGTPIPIIYCETCGEQSVPEIDLPVLLPTDVDFRPTGESPLVRSQSFHTVTCKNCGKKATRESDTMDTFVCSSWYFLRYVSPKDSNVPFETEAMKYWMPVDLYVGGAEHAVLHLLYSRFMTKALRDMGYLSFGEPFVRLRNQGMILGEDGEKMSKSRGNVINPDEVIEVYGADTMRLYEMFMGPFEDQKPWNTKGIIGLRRFLERVWKIYLESEQGSQSEETHETLHRLLNKTIKKVTEDIATFKFNTGISALMVLANEMQKTLQEKKSLPQETKRVFLKLLSPFAPHIVEELWKNMGHTETISYEEWPRYNEDLLHEEISTIIIQINGKVRDQVNVATATDERALQELALSRELVKKWINGKEIKRVVVIKGRIVNIVTE